MYNLDYFICTDISRKSLQLTPRLWGISPWVFYCLKKHLIFLWKSVCDWVRKVRKFPVFQSQRGGTNYFPEGKSQTLPFVRLFVLCFPQRIFPPLLKKKNPTKRVEETPASPSLLPHVEFVSERIRKGMRNSWISLCKRWLILCSAFATQWRRPFQIKNQSIDKFSEKDLVFK